MRLTFTAESFPTLRDIFIQRYGQPTSTEMQPVRTTAGVEYESETLIWTGPVIQNPNRLNGRRRYCCTCIFRVESRSLIGRRTIAPAV